MHTDRGSAWAALVLLACIVCGCGGRSAQEVEAERAKANADWDAQVAGAERARQAEEDKLVQAELAQHERNEEADRQRESEQEAAWQSEEQERLMGLVLAKFPDPAATSISNVRWNTANTALCGV